MKNNVRELLVRQNQRLSVESEQHNTALVLRCRGSFSLVSHTNLDDLIGTIHTADARRIVLDLREVQHIDSTGLGTLATAFKETRARSVDLVVVPSHEVRNALTAVCLDKIFEMRDDLDAALR